MNSLSNCHEIFNKSFNINNKNSNYSPFNMHINQLINLYSFSIIKTSKIRSKILIYAKKSINNLQNKKTSKNNKKIHNLSSRLNLISNLTKSIFFSKDSKEKKEIIKTKCIRINDEFKNKKNNLNNNNLTLKNKNIFIGNPQLNKEKIYKKLLINCKENNYKLFIIKQLKNEVKYLCSNDNNMFTIEVKSNNNNNNINNKNTNIIKINNNYNENDNENLNNIQIKKILMNICI